ncbi:MAG TPA: hypothetical protein VLC92_02875 [Rhodocyclaceae bacterium]|nr:hypothetical protein [Rhodocyclaceae bacterium]
MPVKLAEGVTSQTSLSNVGELAQATSDRVSAAQQTAMSDRAIKIMKPLFYKNETFIALDSSLPEIISFVAEPLPMNEKTGCECLPRLTFPGSPVQTPRLRSRHALPYCVVTVPIWGAPDGRKLKFGVHLQTARTISIQTNKAVSEILSIIAEFSEITCFHSS